MKGITIQQGVEYQLEIFQEWFVQGDLIKGALTLRGGAKSDNLRVLLVQGSFKDVKKSFKIIENLKLHQATNERETYAFQYSLPINCLITDKAESLFVLYGDRENDHDLGILQLNVKPHPVIEEFLMVFDRFHRFKIGAMKNKKGGKQVEVKLTPPDSKEMKLVDSTILSLSLDEAKQLNVTYNFKVKKIGAVAPGASTMEVSKQNKEFQQVLTANDYHQFGSTTNIDRIRELIALALKEVIPKILF